MVITSTHHDGFCLWDSALTDYDITAAPFTRDVLEELAGACREEGTVTVTVTPIRKPDLAS
jgi:alpha-L-fucosidase